MATPKRLGLSVLAVLAVLLVGGMAWAVVGSASGNKTRERNGNMSAMRSGGSGGGPGGMHGMMNATALGLAEDASAEEIKAALDEKKAEMDAKMEAQQEAIDAAIASGDYDAWKTAVGNTRRGEQLTSVITEDNFAKYVEMENYLAKASVIASELGLEGTGMGNGLGKGTGGRGCPNGKPSKEETSGDETE